MFKHLPVQVITGLQRGDEASFNQMYGHYRDLLYVIINSITHHTQTSQDILQDTFIKAYREVSSLRNPLRFHQWIISIARNLALNSLSKQTEVTLDEQTWNQFGSQDQPSDFISLWHSYLTRDENLVIAYRIVYDLSFAEIAKLLERPLPSVYQIYQRAIQQLRQHYKQQGD